MSETMTAHVATIRARFILTSTVKTAELVAWLEKLPKGHTLTYFGNSTPPLFEAKWQRDLEVWDR